MSQQTRGFHLSEDEPFANSTMVRVQTGPLGRSRCPFESVGQGSVPAFLNECSPDLFGGMSLSIHRMNYDLITHSLQTRLLTIRSTEGRVEQTHAPMDRAHVGSYRLDLLPKHEG